MKARSFLVIVALAVALAAVASPAAAPSERAAVIVLPPSAPVFSSPRAAHGLLVVGEGATVSRRGSLASLLRGEMGNAIVSGGLPGGKRVIGLSKRPAKFTFYVALPPPGKHHNVRRYPIAVVGPGYRGVLTDSSTRLTGLISIADVAPSARALERGERPSIRAAPSRDPLARLARFDRRLQRAHDSRVAATLVLVALMILLSLAALLTRAPALCRAAFLVPSACIASAVALSALGFSPRASVLGVALLGGGGALLGGALLPPRLPLALALTAVFAFVFAVMWARPEWNALAVIGPHPDGGGRFYGVTNEVETLLLPPALVLGTLAGVGLLPVVGLALAAGIAASRIGADGGGLVVFLAGFLVLWLRLRRVPALRAAAATAVAAGAALLLVGIDAATGGSSHVTRAVGRGPGSVLGDLGHRLHLYGASIASTWNNALLFALGIVALVVLALQRPRSALLDAYLVALAVSFLVNDTPTDVAGYGGFAALGLWLLTRSEEGRERLE
ncbi:MAG TPA: hypothetical protein VGP56_01840 [Gaiellaceae bacterium]|nr:hypothetical protein [Gaiellaceae bacterium]